MIDLEHLATGRFIIPLAPETPRDILDELDPRESRGGHGYALLVITARRIHPGDLSDADLRSLAIYSGIVLGQGEDRLSIEGRDPIWLLGEDDGGVLWAAADSSQAGWTLAQHLDEWVFGGTGVDRGNGLTRGTTAAVANMTVRFKAGQTPRQTLAWLAARSGNEWKLNYDDLTVDVDDEANLFDSGQIVLLDEGGREAEILGVTADLSLDGLDLESAAWQQYNDWQGDGTSMGSATVTPPSGYDAPDGDAIQWRNYQRGTPKTKLRDDDDVDKVAAWISGNQTASSAQAATMLDRKAVARQTVSAEIDAHNPLALIRPGDTAYVYDPRLGLTDTATQLPFRGGTIFPTPMRCVGMSIPCRPEWGYYLRLSSSNWLDASPYVEPERRTTVLELGRRSKWTRRHARPAITNRRKNRQIARLRVFAQRLENAR